MLIEEQKDILDQLRLEIEGLREENKRLQAKIDSCISWITIYGEDIGYKQVEIAPTFNLSQPAIAQKVKKLKENL